MLIEMKRLGIRIFALVAMCATIGGSMRASAAGPAPATVTVGIVVTHSSKQP
jgi:hypothetical protein